MTKTISFKHSGNTGDIIYALAGMKHICEKQNMKADIRLWLDRKGTYYEGAKHPLGEFIFTDHMYKRIKPLLMAQPWVHSVKKYAGQTIHVDLDLIRQRDVNMPYGHIARWYFYVFPDMACDLSQPWIELPEDDSVDWSEVIIVNRTQRYQNPHIAYSFLRKYENVVFVGTQEEYQILLKQVPNMRFVEFPNFLNLAYAIKHCKVFIGNQSMCFGIAEAVKAPRILEVCSFAPNVIPEGPGPAYDFFSQAAFEYYVNDMVYGDANRVRVPDWQAKKSTPVLEIEHDWSKSRFAQDANGGWYCREEDKDIIDNTLVDVPRLVKIEEYVKQTENLQGAICEVGVYRGGTALLIRRTTNKNLYLFDTFEGMPKVDSDKDLHHTGDFADTSEEHVRNLLGTSNYLIFTGIYKGRFPETIPFNGDMKFSFVHIDVDIYQSVKDCLEYFYARMVKGGIICLDDVLEENCPGAAMAFNEFMADKRESDWMDCQSQRAFVKL